MKKANVDFNKCQVCSKCEARKACPTKALFKLDEDEPATVDIQLCYGCAKCTMECPHNAIYVREL